MYIISPKTNDFFDKRAFSINTRTVVAFLETSQGYEGLVKFGTFMNMPGSLSKPLYNDQNKRLHSAYAGSAKESVENAVQELRDITNPNADANKAVICYFFWQEKGYNSLNRVVTGISRESKKVLDVQVFSRFRNSCSKWQESQETPEYEKWKMTHTCSKNYNVSARSKESKGAINIFSNLIEKCNLRYVY